MTAKKWITGVLAVLVIGLMIAPSLLAQTLLSGDLTGTVTDPSGAVVPNATVTVTSNSTGAIRTTTSNAAGNYRVSLLQAGSYTITATAQGFSKAQTTATVVVGQVATADVKLAVGSTSQTVEVTSAAPLVQAENSDISTSFSQTIIANAPNPGNDLTYIAQTAPGVNMNSGMGYGNFQTAGLPATSNVFTINGENQMDLYLNLNNSGATNLMLGKNEVQEASVVTNAYGGQYGQQAGVQVNYVTKSGTNAFHGNAEYWWTGRAMDANSYINNLNGTPRPFANNNEWAASLGGPIKKDKLFFFADWEGIRYIVPSVGVVDIPSPGFLSAAVSNIAATDPASLGLYQKMQSLYNSATGVHNLANSLPNGGCNEFTGTLGFGAANPCFLAGTGDASEPAKEWLLSQRIDYNMSDKDHIYLFGSEDHGTQATGADFINPAFNELSYQPEYNGQVEWTHTFGSNATNQFVGAGSYYRAIFVQQDAAATFPTQVDLTSVLGYTSLGGPGADGEAVFPQGRNVTQYQFVDDFSVTKGNHTLKFGANYRRYDISDYTFGILTNPLTVITSVSGLFYGGPSAADPAGNLFIQNFPNALSQPVALWGIGLYAQDEWRISKSLKLTFAMRAEHNSNPVCQTDCASLLTGSLYSESAIGPSNPNAGSVAYNSFINGDLHQIFRATDQIDWAPRFGFAWSPGGNDKTVVRGSFGIFYDAFPAFVGDNFMTNVPGVYPSTLIGYPWANQTGPAGVSPWVTGATSAAGFKSGFANGASLNTLSSTIAGFSPPNYNNAETRFRTPRYQEWNLQVEQQLDDKSSMTLAYIGNHGIYEPVTYFPNGAAPFAGFPSSPFTSNLAFVQGYYSGAVSNDNQLTASYQRRLTYGFTISASYTWAHAMDDISNGGFLPYNGVTSYEYQFNLLNLANNYGNADYDIRNSFNAQYVWQTPWKFSNKFVNGAFGGWTLAQNFFARSGLPLTVVDGATSSITNYNGNLIPANVVGNGQGGCNVYLVNCLNPAGFAPAANSGSRFPNQMRNQYIGPGFFDSDFSINT